MSYTCRTDTWYFSSRSQINLFKFTMVTIQGVPALRAKKNPYYPYYHFNEKVVVFLTSISFYLLIFCQRTVFWKQIDILNRIEEKNAYASMLSDFVRRFLCPSAFIQEANPSMLSCVWISYHLVILYRLNCMFRSPKTTRKSCF